MIDKFFINLIFQNVHIDFFHKCLNIYSETDFSSKKYLIMRKIFLYI